MKSLIRFLDNALRRWTPDPFVIAILLTFLTLLLAVISGDVPDEGAGVADRGLVALKAWGDGIWGLAAFTLQMSMILLCGFVVAKSPPVHRGLVYLAGRVKTPTAAVLFCTFAAIVASWINWGFGLVVGGVVALEVSKQVPRAPFRVLVASSYSGFLVWHAGLSGSIPLALNTAIDKTTAEVIGGVIPLSETMFGRVNLIALASIVVLLPIVNWLMLKMVGDEQHDVLDSIYVKQPKKEPIQEDATMSIEKAFWPVLLFAGMGFTYLGVLIYEERFSLNLTTVMTIFFMLGLLLHGSTSAFVKCVTEAAPKIAPILIQYPLYAGIMGMLKGTGLAEQMASWLVSLANAETLPLLTFYSAGLLNLFVPSGGGQWTVQAPVIMEAVKELDADLSKTVVAVAWGDAWTNMLQPFWAVPLLTVAGMKIKEIIGLLLVVLISSGVVLSAVFLLA